MSAQREDVWASVCAVRYMQMHIKGKISNLFHFQVFMDLLCTACTLHLVQG